MVDHRKTTMPSEVEVDIYSGRPNPRFVLGPTQTAEIERRIAALPPLPAGISPRSGLGYRGVLVRGSGTFAELVVSAGTVTIRDRFGHITQKSDPGRQLEQWLIEAGAGHLQQGELEIVRDDLRH